jgi:photosynthetic reaction center cytochrome c subunit
MPWKIMLLSICVAGAVLILGDVRMGGQARQEAAAKAVIKPAEQVYKNIQVLKGVPAEELIPAMQFITASLGVQCDFCHLENAFEKDEKQTKQKARKMMRMMFAINKDNFDGHREVTCYACHRGAHKPVVTPIIGEEESKLATGEETRDQQANPASLPDASQIIDRYLQAIGGAKAAARISTRIQTGTVIVGSQHFPIEILAKAPDQRVSTVHFPGGDSITAIHGEKGWLSTPGRPAHDMTVSELDLARIEAQLFFPAGLERIFRELHVDHKTEINGRETYVVAGIRSDVPAVELYFDEQSGLLVRVLRFVETPLGRNPTQTDYADYRDEGGVKSPFRWIVARPGGRFSIQVDEMQQNVPIEDKKFEKPAVPSQLGPQE